MGYNLEKEKKKKKKFEDLKSTEKDIFLMGWTKSNHMCPSHVHYFVFEDTILQELNEMIKKNGIAGQIYLCCVYTTKGMLRQFSLTLFGLQPM